jgi:hypothetical protein
MIIRSVLILPGKELFQGAREIFPARAKQGKVSELLGCGQMGYKTLPVTWIKTMHKDFSGTEQPVVRLSHGFEGTWGHDCCS